LRGRRDRRLIVAWSASSAAARAQPIPTLRAAQRASARRPRSP
jgi:hypothetical protein